MLGIFLEIFSIFYILSSLSIPSRNDILKQSYDPTIYIKFLNRLTKSF